MNNTKPSWKISATHGSQKSRNERQRFYTPCKGPVDPCLPPPVQELHQAVYTDLVCVLHLNQWTWLERRLLLRPPQFAQAGSLYRSATNRCPPHPLLCCATFPMSTAVEAIDPGSRDD